MLLLAFGVVPIIYAIYLAFTDTAGGFAGFHNFVSMSHSFGFAASFLNIAIYLAVWIVVLVVVSVGIALVLHTRGRRMSAVFRSLYYIPGALGGAASVIMWLFMFDPSVSPYRVVYQLLGVKSLQAVLVAHNLPFLFANMALWAGAGGWVLTLLGAIEATPAEIIDAARVDGCGEVQIARYIKVPLLKRWIAYMAIVGVAAGTQLFVEPQLINTATGGSVATNWSPNELAYTVAFQANNFNGASAISLLLLGIAVIAAVLVVSRTDMFHFD